MDYVERKKIFDWRGKIQQTTTYIKRYYKQF